MLTSGCPHASWDGWAGPRPAHEAARSCIPQANEVPERGSVGAAGQVLAVGRPGQSDSLRIDGREDAEELPAGGVVDADDGFPAGGGQKAAVRAEGQGISRAAVGGRFHRPGPHAVQGRRLDDQRERAQRLALLDPGRGGLQLDRFGFRRRQQRAGDVGLRRRQRQVVDHDQRNPPHADLPHGRRRAARLEAEGFGGPLRLGRRGVDNAHSVDPHLDAARCHPHLHAAPLAALLRKLPQARLAAGPAKAKLPRPLADADHLRTVPEIDDEIETIRLRGRAGRTLEGNFIPGRRRLAVPHEPWVLAGRSRVEKDRAPHNGKLLPRLFSVLPLPAGQRLAIEERDPLARGEQIEELLGLPRGVRQRRVVQEIPLSLCNIMQ